VKNRVASLLEMVFLHYWENGIATNFRRKASATMDAGAICRRNGPEHQEDISLAR
jgi:hypothetical protein